jgi:hypothetical protein
MNRNQKLVIGGLSVVAIIVMTILYFENKKLKKEKKEVEGDNLRLIFDIINRNPDFSEELKLQLEKLVKRFERVNSKISKELVDALQLLQLGRIENAISDLSKIIENLLKVHYLNDEGFKNWLNVNKNMNKDFHGHLKYCYEVDKKITKIEFGFLQATKTVRNTEVHELDLNLSGWLNAAGITAAIDGIIKISDFVYPEIVLNGYVENHNN